MKLARLKSIFSIVAFSCAASLSADSFDVSDPDQALMASNKLFCANEPGEYSLFWWQGSAWSRIPGEKDKHIFNVQGMNMRQCAKFEDPVKGVGFRSVSREIMLYLDPEPTKSCAPGTIHGPRKKLKSCTSTMTRLTAVLPVIPATRREIPRPRSSLTWN